jgi:uncharacterized protein YjbI with pentapeptide repeats
MGTDDKVANDEPQKDLLDKSVQVAQLLGTLAILGTLIFGVIQFNINQEQSNTQQKENAAQALDEQRQATLNGYLDDMSALVLRNQLTSSPAGAPARAIAVARTDTALRNLDGPRKGTLIRYLWEANLITEPQPVVTLFHVNLSGAMFVGADLRQADLSSNDLMGANFSGASPNGADLSGADLSGANLSNANLSCFKGGGSLSGGILRPGSSVTVVCTRSADPSLSADLGGANLSGADVRDANLMGADLSGADLSGADIEGATYNSKPIPLTDAQGDTLSVRPTQWPKGFNPTARGATCVDC